MGADGSYVPAREASTVAGVSAPFSSTQTSTGAGMPSSEVRAGSCSGVLELVLVPLEAFALWA